MKRAWLVLLSVFGLLAAAPSAWAVGQRQLVLVSAAADVPTLSPLELQKLFLGMPIAKNGHRLLALRNQSDTLLYEVFLQKVIFMSAKTYEYQVLSQVFESGSQRPPSYADTDTLVDALHGKAYSVSYMWMDSVKPHHRLRVVQELWHGSTE